jgi:hypothetical protein
MNQYGEEGDDELFCFQTHLDIFNSFLLLMYLNFFLMSSSEILNLQKSSLIFFFLISQLGLALDWGLCG